MARIRSIHPGLFTDEAYMALSLAARELLKGLWCECDDDGVFDWKPLTLKARILPADTVNMDELLAELHAGRFLCPFENDGRRFGAVRNFRKYQRPKKPNSRGLLLPGLRTYVGITGDGSELADDDDTSVPHQLPTEGGKSPQMEDGGGGGSPKGESNPSFENLRDAISAAPRRLGANGLNGGTMDADSRKGIWFNRVLAYVRAKLPRDELESLVAGYLGGDKFAKDQWEIWSKREAAERKIAAKR